MRNERILKKIEQGRAEFAYRCVDELLKLKSIKDEINKVFQNFIEKVCESFKKEIEKKEINEDRIRKILSNIEKYVSENSILNDTEKEVLKKYKNFIDNYKSYSKKLPQMIFSNGLGQTLAFVKSKAKKGNAYELLYQQMTSYLKSNSSVRINMPHHIPDIVKWVISSDSDTYKHITKELLAFLSWLKRFAEGMIKGEE